jgi:hypothetical protein
MKRVETTPEQRAEILQRVDALKKQGMKFQEAWEQAGVGHYTNYFSWKRRKNRVKAVPKKTRKYQRRKHVTVEMAPAPHIVAQFVLFSDGNIANLADLKRAA